MRYMDDWVVLAPTRWTLRRAIKEVNEVMARFLVVQHPEKTVIGRIARGFDFRGYWFSPVELAIAPKTVERCAEKVSRLYEQGANVVRIGTYLGRWVAWGRVRVVVGWVMKSGRDALCGAVGSRCQSKDLTPCPQ